MVGWSILASGSTDLDHFEILKNLQKNGFLCLDLDAVSVNMGGSGGDGDGSKEKKLRSYFYQILYAFLERISVSDFMVPVPCVLGDGRSVDMYKLFMVVRGKGGFHSVSKSRLWNVVAEESGLDSEVGSSVKLFYFKYLDPFDRWILTFFRVKGRGGRDLELAECGGNLVFLPMELEKELKCLLCRIIEQGRRGSEKSDSQASSIVGDTINMNGVTSDAKLAGDQKCDDNDVEMMDYVVVNETVLSRKRKLENLSEMLNWVLEIATNPCDAELQKFMEQKAKGGQDHLGLALLVRNALFQKRSANSSGENSNLQKRQKVHPSMYEDEVSGDNISTERSRCSRRLSEKELRLQNESSCKDKSATSFGRTENDQRRSRSESVTADTVTNPFHDDPSRKRVPIGSLFQAEVPEWTGIAVESDSKWLGTPDWPLNEGRENSVTDSSLIGKGRKDSCNCRLPGSVECLRFHTAENKMKLKLELGLAFYNWRFHHMGEEVSLSWTKEEEDKFQTIVRQNPSSQGKGFGFWNHTIRRFPTKSRKNLVSYYFNVFVLRRRCYQNRVTPNAIDSDDDDSEFGSVCNGFGDEAIKVPEPSSMVCTQNYRSLKWISFTYGY